MPFVDGGMQPAAEALARRRSGLQANLLSMEERYQRYVRSNTTHHPDAAYLKQCIDDAKRTLRGR